ncbi:MAG TPA: hypothetical protein VN864_05485 [Thermoplasmata archaeon]|nr:hypothetical protein [Thermoplasmata archaeon]
MAGRPSGACRTTWGLRVAFETARTVGESRFSVGRLMVPAHANVKESVAGVPIPNRGRRRTKARQRTRARSGAAS